MLLRMDQFGDLDRLANELLGTPRAPQPMPMECYRAGDTFYLHFDLPGIDPDSLEVTAENNTLTVRATRQLIAPDGATYLVAERAPGSYARQLVLGDGLNLEAIGADYHDGVLTLTIPVAEQAKPRKIAIGRESQNRDARSNQRVISGQASDRTPAEASA